MRQNERSLNGNSFGSIRVASLDRLGKDPSIVVDVFSTAILAELILWVSKTV